MVFFALGTVVFALLTIYSFALYPLIVKRLPSKPLAFTDAPPQPITLLFCCYNEAQSIHLKLENIAAIRRVFPALEVKVYLDGCTDQSEDIINASGLPIQVYKSPRNQGKNLGLNEMMRDVTTPLVAFTDANIIIEPEAFINVQKYFSDASVGCVSGHLTYINEAAGGVAYVSGKQWRAEAALKLAESATGSTPAVNGPLFFIRRALFETLPNDAPNDLYSALTTLIQGYRVISAEDIKLFEKTPEKSLDEVHRKIRIARRCMTCHLYLRSRLRSLSFIDQFKYISHKLLRWFTGVWLALTAFFAVGFLLTTMGALASWLLLGGSILWLAASFTGVSVIRSVNHIILAFLAASYGAITALCGKRQSVWHIPLSSR